MMKDKLWTRSFLAVAGGNFLLFFAFYLLLPVLPMYLMEQFGSNKATVGVILSSYTITALFVRLLQDTWSIHFPVSRYS